MATTAQKKRAARQADPDITGPEDIDWSKAKVIGRGLKAGKRISLRALRTGLGKTQVDIARAAELEQSEVSRIEQRDDLKTSTLERYASALGGKLEIAIVIDGRRYLIAV